jgi:hypothetical protein
MGTCICLYLFHVCICLSLCLVKIVVFWCIFRKCWHVVSSQHVYLHVCMELRIYIFMCQYGLMFNCVRMRMSSFVCHTKGHLVLGHARHSFTRKSGLLPQSWPWWVPGNHLGGLSLGPRRFRNCVHHSRLRGPAKSLQLAKMAYENKLTRDLEWLQTGNREKLEFNNDMVITCHNVFKRRDVDQTSCHGQRLQHWKQFWIKTFSAHNIAKIGMHIMSRFQTFRCTYMCTEKMYIQIGAWMLFKGAMMLCNGPIKQLLVWLQDRPSNISMTTWRPSLG